jgi:hypothetical protein
VHRFVVVTDNAGWWEVHEMSDAVFEQAKELAIALQEKNKTWC